LKRETFLRHSRTSCAGKSVKNFVSRFCIEKMMSDTDDTNWTTIILPNLILFHHAEQTFIDVA
jgi:hypothetical protein